ncbi:CAB4 Phosphopantetheine adenylyltransferase [Candida maltosa Xu316]|uniref:Cytidyltransferase-like domain-containing protein n=1 Tax=Candida maltosa (strain Xu316) TaxID=1245528 RepID=M3K3M3_CANMX|nr:hypothetical protein G210_5893 [Candida maltosa Xu316]
MNPAIIIPDPIHKDYKQYILSILPKLTHVNRLDILILTPITHTSQLNQTLSTYYQLVRTHIEENLDTFSYLFETNIIFNQTSSQINHLAIHKWSHIHSPIPIPNIPQSLKLPLIDIDIPDIDELEGNGKVNGEFRVSAVGGTFDHLHDAHKILLSLAYFVTKEKLIIGITNEELLKKKKFKDVLESFDKRMCNVLGFLKLLNGIGIRVEVFSINDVCGPTGYIPDIQSLIVSEETISGASFVNDFRRKKGFGELEVVEIKVIGDDESSLENSWKGKLSSTDIREREYNRLVLNK